jgi:hypothetical protein
MHRLIGGRRVSDLNQPAYYARREQQERALANAALSADIRAIHLELAEQYARLSREAEPAPARPRLRLVFS